MKKLFIVPFICLAVLLLNSCKKDSSATNTESVYTMAFKVDGVDQSTSTAGAFSSTGNILTLNGSLNNQGSLSIALNSPSVGTYTLSGSTPAAGIISITYFDGPSASSNIYYGTDATVNITSLSSTAIAGTFQLTCAGVLNSNITKKITEGKFNLKIYKP